MPHHSTPCCCGDEARLLKGSVKRTCGFRPWSYRVRSTFRHDGFGTGRCNGTHRAAVAVAFRICWATRWRNLHCGTGHSEYYWSQHCLSRRGIEVRRYEWQRYADSSALVNQFHVCLMLLRLDSATAQIGRITERENLCTPSLAWERCEWRDFDVFREVQVQEHEYLTYVAPRVCDSQPKQFISSKTEIAHFTQLTSISLQIFTFTSVCSHLRRHFYQYSHLLQPSHKCH